MDSEIIVAIIGGVVTLGNVAYTTISAKRERKKHRNSDVEKGLQCLLRAEIIRSHEKYIDRGECPLYAKEALTQVYDSYHALGGNGTVTRLYNTCLDLPTKL